MFVGISNPIVGALWWRLIKVSSEVVGYRVVHPMCDVVLSLERFERLEKIFRPTIRSSACEEVVVSFRCRVAFPAKWGRAFGISVEPGLGGEEFEYPFTDGLLVPLWELKECRREAIPIDVLVYGYT